MCVYVLLLLLYMCLCTLKPSSPYHLIKIRSHEAYCPYLSLHYICFGDCFLDRMFYELETYFPLR